MNKMTLFLVLAGFVVRLFLIFPGPLESKVEFFYNRADLRNYYWPAQAALGGANPYALWAQGQSGELRADMAPLELALYVATVAVWNDPRAIQILFALFDTVNLVLLSALLKRSRLRRPFQIFYAFSPLTIYNLVLVPADKTIVLALTFLIFYLLTLPKERVSRFTLQVANSTGLIIVAALLASFKWLSVFYLLPLLTFVSRDWRDFIKQGLVFSAVIALAHLPWIPDWLYVYQFRLGRTTAPSHIAPAVLLNAVGLFDPAALMIVLVASLAAIYGLFWLKRIDIFETIALTTAAGILWTPDMDPVHLSLVVISFLLVVDWTRCARWLTIWILSAWSVAIYILSTRVFVTRFGIFDWRATVGVYGSPQVAILSYGLLAAMVGFYLFDKLRGHAVGRNVLVEVTR